MGLSLRTTILATGCILAIGTSAARAQTPSVFYYPAPGSYATMQGTVNIPAAGYYYNVPLYGVAAPVSPAPAQGFTYSSFYYPPNSSSFSAPANRPAQGFTYSSFYYPPSSSSLNPAANPPAQVPTYSYFYYPPAPSSEYDPLGYRKEGPYWQLQRE